MQAKFLAVQFIQGITDRFSGVEQGISARAADQLALSESAPEFQGTLSRMRFTNLVAGSTKVRTASLHNGSRSIEICRRQSLGLSIRGGSISSTSRPIVNFDHRAHPVSAYSLSVRSSSISSTSRLLVNLVTELCRRQSLPVWAMPPSMPLSISTKLPVLLIELIPDRALPPMVSADIRDAAVHAAVDAAVDRVEPRRLTHEALPSAIFAALPW